MSILAVIQQGEATAWFADWLLADPPPGMEVNQPVFVAPQAPPRLQIAGTVVKLYGNVYVLTGRKWKDYWEGKWPD
jgi:hypothetical protein